MSTSTDELLAMVERFIRAKGLSARRFGVDAVKDPNFVFDLRSGRRVWPETRARVMDYIVSGAPPATPHPDKGAA